MVKVRSINRKEVNRETSQALAAAEPWAGLA